jgi:hypothetical protein
MSLNLGYPLEFEVWFKRYFGTSLRKYWKEGLFDEQTFFMDFFEVPLVTKDTVAKGYGPYAATLVEFLLYWNLFQVCDGECEGCQYHGADQEEEE